MVLDIFTYNGEKDILRLHLGVLNDYVDKFIIVEANKTFTGNTKPLFFFREQNHFKKYWNKIEYYVVDNWDDVALWKMALESPNTMGADHWKREFYIKESIQKALTKHAKPDDTLLIGDVDEMINPEVQFISDKPVKAKLGVYAYWLDNRSNEEFWGTLITQYKDVQGKCLNHVRSDTKLNSKGKNLGWHFTSMGGEKAVRQKLDDQYTEESYNTQETKIMLEKRLKNGLDYLGRDFIFTKDESDWPEYLKTHKALFTNLIK